MPADYGLLTQGVPQFNPQLANMGGAITQGINDNSVNQMRNAMTQSQQLDNQIKKFSTIQNLAGALHFNATQQNLDATKQMLQQMGMGEYAQALPDKIEDAKPIIESSYYASGMYLKNLMAMGELNYKTSFMDRNTAEADHARWSMGQGSGTGNNQPTNGATTTATPGSTINPPSGATTSGGPPSQPNPFGITVPGTGPAATATGGSSVTPSLPSSAVNGPAALAQQTDQGKTQGKNWSDFMDAYSDVGKNYLPMKQQLDQLDNLIDYGANKYTGDALPGQGYLLNKTPEGQQLDVLGKALNLNYTAALTKAGGISRLDIPLVKAIQFLTPGTDKYPANNHLETSRIRLTNELGNGMGQLLPTLNAMGMSDPNQAISIFNKAISKTGVLDTIDPKKGINNKTNFYKAFNQWPQYLPQDIKEQYFKNNFINRGTPVFQDSEGNLITNDDIQAKAKARGVSEDALVKAYKLQPWGGASGVAQYPQLPMSDQQIQNLRGRFG